jgi:secondary thiamine-phosphate synthase enzyme
MMKTFSIPTNESSEMIDVTDKIQSTLSIRNGFVYLYCPHTTAGLTINENADPSVKADILRALDAMVPDLTYTHMEGNSPSHIKASLVGKHLQIAVEDGQLVLGTWDGIYFCEFDGPRTRTLMLKEVEE